MSITEDFARLTEWMGDASARVHRAVRNMREVSPGFPSSTPGNGSPGGGRWTPGADTIVERLAMSGEHVGTIDRDDALADLRRLEDIARQMRPLVREARDICMRWGYSTAGEFHVGERRQPGRPTEGDTNAAKWCTSCARLQKAEPVGDKGRRGLCRWCADFEDAERTLPPLALLDLRHRGARITSAVVAQLKKEGQVAPRPRKKRRR